MTYHYQTHGKNEQDRHFGLPFHLKLKQHRQYDTEHSEIRTDVKHTLRDFVAEVGGAFFLRWW
jgi:hypothetical protein